MRVRVARDELRRIRELSQTIKALETEIAQLVAQIAPHLLSEPGLGPLTAAKLVGEIAGAGRFATDAKLARAAGVAPIPVSSGKTNRHRLDRGGNRQINAAIHRIAVTRARCHPETQDYIARKTAEDKTTREPSAASNATSPAASGTSCAHPTPTQKHRHHHQFLDIEATGAGAWPRSARAFELDDGQESRARARALALRHGEAGVRRAGLARSLLVHSGRLARDSRDARSQAKATTSRRRARRS
jgi:transposase IS116/IS110/IS902 family protein